MSGVLREFILALTGGAVICFLALTLCPEGRVKGVLRLVCGVVMAAAMLSPFADLDYEAYSAALARYRIRADEAAESGRFRADELERTIIQSESAAYILDKAEGLGIACTASVLARWSGEDGLFYPYEATVRLSSGGARRGELMEHIAAGLGIPAERVTWEEA